MNIIRELIVRMIDSAKSQNDARFKVLQQSPITDFAVLNYRQWPTETSELAVYGKKEIDNLVKHFAPVQQRRKWKVFLKSSLASRFM